MKVMTNDMAYRKTLPLKDSSEALKELWGDGFVLRSEELLAGRSLYMFLEIFDDNQMPHQPLPPDKLHKAMEKSTVGFLKLNAVQFIMQHYRGLHAASKKGGGSDASGGGGVDRLLPRWYELSGQNDDINRGRIKLSIFFKGEKTSTEEMVAICNASDDRVSGVGRSLRLKKRITQRLDRLTSERAAFNLDLTQPPPRREVHSFDVKNKQGKACSFTVDKHYQFVKILGQGAYGFVIAATDTRTKEIVAIKNIQGAFKDKTDGKRILREIRLMCFMDHDNVMKLRDLIPPKYGFNDLYLVADVMDSDLHLVLKQRELSEDIIRWFPPPPPSLPSSPSSPQPPTTTTTVLITTTITATTTTAITITAATTISTTTTVLIEIAVATNHHHCRHHHLHHHNRPYRSSCRHQPPSLPPQSLPPSSLLPPPLPPPQVHLPNDVRHQLHAFGGHSPPGPQARQHPHLLHLRSQNYGLRPFQRGQFLSFFIFLLVFILLFFSSFDLSRLFFFRIFLIFLTFRIFFLTFRSCLSYRSCPSYLTLFFFVSYLFIVSYRSYRFLSFLSFFLRIDRIVLRWAKKMRVARTAIAKTK
jgi:hypothetical protein